jgi:hypothetical protein
MREIATNAVTSLNAMRIRDAKPNPSITASQGTDGRGGVRIRPLTKITTIVLYSVVRRSVHKRLYFSISVRDNSRFTRLIGFDSTAKRSLI